MTAEGAEQSTCLNCGTALQGPFCARCGQNQRTLNRFFWTLVSETFEDIVSLNSRTVRTMTALMIHPGRLTKEYFDGRRASYLPPLRLYIIASFAFFFYLSVDIMFGFRPQPQKSDEPIAQELENMRSGSREAIDSMQIDSLSDEDNAAIRQYLTTQSEKVSRVIQEDPTDLFKEALDIVPAMAIILLPLFALAFKLCYLGGNRYYAEHLLLALHNHSFLFFALILNRMLEHGFLAVDLEVATNIVPLAIVLYLFVSMRVYYGEGIAKTLAKFSFLSACYFVLATITMIVAFALGVLTL
jgi:hypothetical protein